MIWHNYRFAAGFAGRLSGAACGERCPAQLAQFGQGAVDLIEVGVEQLGDPAAGLGAAALQVEDVARLLQGQAQGLGAADEPQHVQVGP